MDGDQRSVTRVGCGRIVHVSTSDLAIKYLLANQLRGFQSLGYQVFAASNAGGFRGELEHEPFAYSCLPIARRIQPVSDWHSHFRMKRYFQRMDFDLVHTHTNKAGIMGCWAAKSAGVPRVVSTVHGFYFHENMGRVLRRFFVNVYRETFKHVHRAFMQSQEDVDTAITLGILSEEQIVHIGNGIDLKRFNPGRAELYTEGLSLRRIKGIPDSAFVIGIVARVNHEKGIRELLHAMPRVLANTSDDVRLVVIGDGPARGDFENLACSLGIADAVAFTGTQENIPAWLSVMDLFTLPSYREGFPRSLCEAFAMGVCCVATRIRGCRELIDDGITGSLVPPQDEGSLSETLIRLLRSEEKRGDLGKAARKYATDHLDEQRIIDRIVAEYRALGVHPSTSSQRVSVGRSNILNTEGV